MREAEPLVGLGVEGEALVVLGEDVVEAVEEEPGLLGSGDTGGEGGGGGEGAPGLAGGGGEDDGADGKVGEDELGEVSAERLPD